MDYLLIGSNDILMITGLKREKKRPVRHLSGQGYMVLKKRTITFSTENMVKPKNMPQKWVLFCIIITSNFKIFLKNTIKILNKCVFF